MQQTAEDSVRGRVMAVFKHGFSQMMTTGGAGRSREAARPALVVWALAMSGEALHPWHRRSVTDADTKCLQILTLINRGTQLLLLRRSAGVTGHPFGPEKLPDQEP